MTTKYLDYFDIDPGYFPVINEAVIEHSPDLWKNFFPHKTFIGLLENVVSMLENKTHRSIWVDGSYGTGKSYAVLTLKKLLEASDEEMKAYFDKYVLSNDLYNKLTQQKNDGCILVVHRYGSASINNDDRLINAIQTSISAALKDAGIDDRAHGSLRDAILDWINGDEGRRSFLYACLNKYSDTFFGGKNAEEIMVSLERYENDALLELTSHILKVAELEGMNFLSLDIDKLKKWIEDVISANKLKAIVFIWDEFSEYFMNNRTSLTGFQGLAELSETKPFYYVIVTHTREEIFQYLGNNAKRIMGRFIDPSCRIELPQNTALQLIGLALHVTDDPVLSQEWKKRRMQLATRTHEVRKMIQNVSSVHIEAADFDAILPIHPYAAVVLRVIANFFQANQRSMFEFIKDENILQHGKSFRWFIGESGPTTNPLLTIDQLWDFFYEKGKNNLSDDIRAILDAYGRTRNLDDNEQRVLKTILMLQAISRRSGDAVELYATTKRNLDLAFEGTSLDKKAADCADKLVRDGVIYVQTIGNEEQYSVLIGGGDARAIDKEKDRLRNDAKTSRYVMDGGFDDAFREHIVGALKLRYETKTCGADNFDQVSNNMKGQCGDIIAKGKIPAVVVFAKNDIEATEVAHKIKRAIQIDGNEVIYIDAGNSTLGTKDFDRYIDQAGNAAYWNDKNKSQAQQYAANAKKILEDWCVRIMNGTFTVSYRGASDSDMNRPLSMQEMINTLKLINKEKYPDSLEVSFNVINNMYESNSMPLGVECGTTRQTKGTFKSANSATKLENALQDVWDVTEYWKDRPHLLISKIKARVISTVDAGFDRDGRVSIREIYDELKAAPFGFLPCNLTAFVIGFVLKEYVDDGKYTYSDGTTSSTLDVDHLRDMVSEILKEQTTPNQKYKDKYIVALTEEQKAFNKTTSIVFDIPPEYCSSIENTRGRIIEKMKRLPFPLWSVEHVIEGAQIKTPKEDLIQLIELYIGLANTHNLAGGASESDIATRIGKTCIEHPTAKEDLQKLVTKDMCRAGMENYLRAFDDGRLLVLSQEIGDGGEYIRELEKKFSADSATWLWNKDEADKRIGELILDYRIISESNKIVSKCSTFRGAIDEWISKCRNIKVAYDAAKNDLDELRPLLNMLYNIRRVGELRENEKEKFLVVVRSSGETFRSFYTQGQIPLFRRVCSIYLEGLQEDDIAAIFDSIPQDMFTHEAKDYLLTVERCVKDYRNSQVAEQLRAFWREQTGTGTPREWSRKYQMPILWMITDDINAARYAFETVNSSRPNENDVRKTREYFDRNMTLFDMLKSDEARNAAFAKNIDKTYSALLSVDEIKEILAGQKGRIGGEPYEWNNYVSVVNDILKPRAQNKYTIEGADKAQKIIDDMGIDDAKRYLRELIKDNMIVGIEIIKSAKA